MAQLKKKSFEELEGLLKEQTAIDVLNMLADFMDAGELEKFLKHVKDEFGL